MVTNHYQGLLQAEEKTPLASCLTIETENIPLNGPPRGLHTKHHLFRLAPCQELSPELLSQHREDKER